MHCRDIDPPNVQIFPRVNQNELDAIGVTPVLRLGAKMTKDEFCHKWVGYIRYTDRDDRDQLWEEMYQDLQSIDSKKSNSVDKDCRNTKK